MNIELVDSSEYHKDNRSEIQYQLRSVADYIRYMLRSRWFYVMVIGYVGFRYAVYYGVEKPYVIVGAIILILNNLGERKKGEMSAYSVFNKGNYKVLGDMDVDQLDGQLRNRARIDYDDDDVYQFGQDRGMDQDQYITQFQKMSVSKKANLPCYCQSGRKYKKCCYWKELKGKQEDEERDKQELRRSIIREKEMQQKQRR